MYSLHRPVRVVLPEAPAAWASLLNGSSPPAYRLVRRASDLAEESLTIPAGTVAAELNLPKERTTAVVAYPLVTVSPTGSGGRGDPRVVELRPAGAVYPHQLEEPSVLRLSWKSGAPASLLHRLALHAGLDWINVGRLLDAYAEADTASPWDIDVGRVLRKLWEQEFRSSYVGSREAAEVDIGLPAETWIPADPFKPPLNVPHPAVAGPARSRPASASVPMTVAGAVEAPVTVREELTVGLHRYINARRTLEAHLYLNDRMELTVLVR